MTDLQSRILQCSSYTYLHNPSWYSVLICRHFLSTTYISKNHQSVISPCITSCLESTSCLIPSALHKSLLMTSHSVIHIPSAQHSHPPSRIHYFIPAQNSPFPHIFSNMLAPTGLPSRIILTYSA